EEPGGGDVVGGDDGVGVMRSVAFDMRDGGGNVVHDLHGDDGIEIFGAPIFLGRSLYPIVDRLRCDIAAHFATRRDQHFDQRFEVVGCAAAVDQQRFRRAAHAGAAHLGVQYNFLGHVERSREVHEHVANPFEVREYRHPGLRLYARHQTLAATGNDHVDIAVEPLQHQADGRAVTGWDPLHRGLG